MLCKHRWQYVTAYEYGFSLPPVNLGVSLFIPLVCIACINNASSFSAQKHAGEH